VGRVELNTESTQTDPMNKRSPPGAFIAPKIGECPIYRVIFLLVITIVTIIMAGLDVATQVQPESGELFDFSTFVQPILSVIVSKTIEQSLMEVRQEEEMKSIRSRKVRNGAWYQRSAHRPAQAKMLLNENKRRKEISELEEKETRQTKSKVSLLIFHSLIGIVISYDAGGRDGQGTEERAATNSSLSEDALHEFVEVLFERSEHPSI
jgi:hypothetical protein